jgi:hypothetical protein
MYNTKILSGFMMALGLSFHFFGYEAARAASISLLAAKVFLIYNLNFNVKFIFNIYLGDSSWKRSPILCPNGWLPSERCNSISLC